MTKEAFAALRHRVDGFVLRDNMPPAIKGVYAKIRDMIIAYGDVEGQARAREAAGNAGTAGAGPTATAHARSD